MEAVLASVAGSLYACHFNFLAPEMVNTPLSLEQVSMMIIGGDGTLVGPVLGVAPMRRLPTAARSLASYKAIATGVLLVVFFPRLPAGMSGGLAPVVRGRA